MLFRLFFFVFVFVFVFAKERYVELTHVEIDMFCSSLPDFWQNIDTDWAMILLNVYHDIYDEHIYRAIWKQVPDMGEDIIDLILEFVWNSDYERHFPPCFTFEIKNVENAMSMMADRMYNYDNRPYGMGRNNNYNGPPGQVSQATYQSWMNYFNKKRKYRKIRKDEGLQQAIQQWKDEQVEQNKTIEENEDDEEDDRIASFVLQSGNVSDPSQNDVYNFHRKLLGL